MNRKIRPAAFCKRAGSCALLDIDQLTKRVAAKISEFLHFAESVGNGDVDVPLIDRYKRYNLVLRPFHEKLDLAVLIGRAERREWRLSN